MLVQIDNTKCINTDTMKKVWRNGNYTEIILVDGQLISIWDEDEILWSRITNAIKQESSK